MNFYTWMSLNEQWLSDQELMLGRSLRRAELRHLYNNYLRGIGHV